MFLYHFVSYSFVAGFSVCKNAKICSISISIPMCIAGHFFAQTSEKNNTNIISCRWNLLHLDGWGGSPAHWAHKHLAAWMNHRTHPIGGYYYYTLWLEATGIKFMEKEIGRNVEGKCRPAWPMARETAGAACFYMHMDVFAWRMNYVFIAECGLALMLC